MGKYFNFSVYGYMLYCTAFCGAEPLHVHASTRKLTEANSAKLWMGPNGNTVVANQGNIPSHTMTKIRQFIKDNHADIIEHWCKLFNVAEPEFKHIEIELLDD